MFTEIASYKAADALVFDFFADYIKSLCFTHRMPAWRVALHTPSHSYFGWCGGLVRLESWVLYDSVLMTGNLVIFR